MTIIVLLWDMMVVSLAVIAMVIIVLGLMIRVIDPLSAFRRIGTTLGCMIVLVMVPSIIVHLWGALSVWEQLGIIALVGLLAAVAWARCQGYSRKRSARQNLKPRRYSR